MGNITYLVVLLSQLLNFKPFFLIFFRADPREKNLMGRIPNEEVVKCQRRNLHSTLPTTQTSFPSIMPNRTFRKVSAGKESGVASICSNTKAWKHIRSHSKANWSGARRTTEALPALLVEISWRWKILSKNNSCLIGVICNMWYQLPFACLGSPPSSHRVSTMVSRLKASRVLA